MTQMNLGNGNRNRLTDTENKLAVIKKEKGRRRDKLGVSD